MTVALRLLLAILAWLGILTLQVVVMAIARFFQRSAHRVTWYPVYLLAMLLTTVGMWRYILRIPQATPWLDFTGDPLANLLLCAAGLLLLGLGNHLQELMLTGGPP